MAETYIKNNRATTKEFFNERLSYDVKMARIPYKNLVNFNFGEKYMYGRVNRFFIPMVLNKDRAPIRKFDRTIAKTTGAGALPFVVDAFNKLAQQFRKCAAARKIDPSDPFLSNLVVYKAYTSPDAEYSKYKKGYFTVMASTFRKDNVKVRNFDEFTQHLLLTLEKTAPRNPVTKPGFVKSRHAPITCSGLAIEIANLSATNDQQKIDQFVNSNNWNFYLNACASYGFMVDRRVPWRLVADIGIYPERSPMIEYAAQYGLSTTNRIIDTYYKNAHTDYYERFKTDLLSLYNQVKSKSFLVREDCKGKTRTRRVVPITYTAASLFKKYSEEDFLRMYFTIRFFEEESRFTANQKSLMIDDCIELYLQGGISLSLDSFERILNKTFDYRGSLGYIKKQVEAMADEKIRKHEQGFSTPGISSTPSSMGPFSGY